jgi:hypothetical protein
MGVDDGGNDRLAREIDASSTRGRFRIRGRTDPREAIPFDQGCAVLDGATVADDDPRAVEQRRPARLSLGRHRRPDVRRRKADRRQRDGQRHPTPGTRFSHHTLPALLRTDVDSNSRRSFCDPFVPEI